MGSAILSLENIDLPRNDQNDLVVLRNGDELLGVILNDTYSVETLLGKLDLPAAGVVGLNVPADDDPQVQVVLTDGQVVAGKLLNAPLKVKLVNGNEISLPVKNMKTASFKMSPERPEQVTASPMLVLRCGQRLFIDPSNAGFIFHTEYGDITVSPDEVVSLQMDTPDSGLHRLLFSNGSVLSGLLVADELAMHLDLGPEIRIPQGMVKRFDFPSPEQDHKNLAVVTLRNKNQLYGRLAEESLAVDTKYGQVKVDAKDVAQVQFLEDAWAGAG